NPNLKPEENRSLEGGVEQGFAENRYSLSAIYFNNLFTNQIAFQVINPLTFESKYLNLNRALAHGAELELKARPASRVNLSAGYARLDLGGWRQLNHCVTAYANLENLLKKHYEDVPGYPAPRLNIRAGLRFRVGGE